ncbi:MAG: carboxypeptidase-like regulatory domain-containing protein [Bacteroidota bacterium]
MDDITKIGLLLFLNLLTLTTIFGQEEFSIKGKITDAQTGETLPFATVVYVGNESVGTTTDVDGKYELHSKFGTDSIQATFLGYESQIVAIDRSKKSQTIDFQLTTEAVTLVVAEVKVKKERYQRKENYHK